MHHFHVYQDFFHNGRPCGTSEVTSIKEAIRLHTARGWNQVCAPYRKRINGQSLLFVEFDTGSLFSTENSVLRFRFSPTGPTTRQEPTMNDQTCMHCHDPREHKNRHFCNACRILNYDSIDATNDIFDPNWDVETQSMRHDIGLYCECEECCPECHEPTPDDLDAIASWSWSGYRAQLREFGWIEHGKRVFPALALAAFLAITQIPAGCTITGHTSEGFPVATCADGSRIYADMDGAGGYNSGLPYVIPGTWVELG